MLITTTDTNGYESSSSSAGNESEPIRGEGESLLQRSFAYTMVISVVLTLIILSTIVGNVFVIAAIILERNLQNVANYLVASLAVADLFVAALVMPLAAVAEVTTWWFLGRVVCAMWTSFDVLCCTSSILHLVAISMDRYWAVTRVDYIRHRSSKRIFIMITLSWSISLVISIPQLVGFKDAETDSHSGSCLISQDWGYTVFSTMGAFYIPLLFMIVIYLNIYRAARSRIRKKHFRLPVTSSSSSSLRAPKHRHKEPVDDYQPVETPTTPSSTRVLTGPANGPRSQTCFSSTVSVTSGANPETSFASTSNAQIPSNVSSTSFLKATQTSSTQASSPPLSPSPSGNGTNWTADGSTTTLDANVPPSESSKRSTERRLREKREQVRERKAARTLAIITGTFVVCWLPFFIIALVRPFCGPHCSIPDVIASVALWLGYVNSLLNPVIYTVFNPDFRLAFGKILFGKYRKQKAYRGQLQTGQTKS